MTSEQINQLISICISVLGAFASLMVVWFKTRTKYLEAKYQLPFTLKGKCILFKCPDSGKTYLIDLDEEDILNKSDVTYDIIKSVIDLDKPKKGE